MQLKNFWSLTRQSVSAWVDDYAPSMGAAISYYTVFSLAPLLLIVIAVAGFVWGRDAVQGEIVAQLAGLLGDDAAKGVQDLLIAAYSPAQGPIAAIIGFAVLAFGATTVFAELQSALDRIWQVPASQKKSGILATVRARLLSLGLVLGLGFLLSVSLVISAGVAAFGGWANGLLPGSAILLFLANTGLSIAATTVLFAMIFKLMPQAKVAWQDVWVGAVVTAVLLEVGKVLIGLYIGKSSISSTFAAAGSVVVVLVWVYYAAQIFLLGAEFTWVYAKQHGSLSGEAAAAFGRSPSTQADSVSPQPPAEELTMSTTLPSMRDTPARGHPTPLSMGQKAAIIGGGALLQLLVRHALASRARRGLLRR